MERWYHIRLQFVIKPWFRISFQCAYFFHTTLSKSVGVKLALSEPKPLKLLSSSSPVGVVSVIICMSVKDTVLESPPSVGMRIPEVIIRDYCEGEFCKGCDPRFRTGLHMAWTIFSFSHHVFVELSRIYLKPKNVFSNWILSTAKPRRWRNLGWFLLRSVMNENCARLTQCHTYRTKSPFSPRMAASSSWLCRWSRVAVASFTT